MERFTNLYFPFQLSGKLRILLNEEDTVNLVISKHGIKIVDPKTEVSVGGIIVTITPTSVPQDCQELAFQSSLLNDTHFHKILWIQIG